MDQIRILFVCQLGEERSPWLARTTNEAAKKANLQDKVEASFAGVRDLRYYPNDGENQRKLNTSTHILAVEPRIANFLISTFPSVTHKVQTIDEFAEQTVGHIEDIFPKLWDKAQKIVSTSS